MLQSKRKVQKDSFEQKENRKVYGQLCNASRVPSGIPTQKKRYTCEVNSQANCISQKVKLVKRDRITCNEYVPLVDLVKVGIEHIVSVISEILLLRDFCETVVECCNLTQR